MGVFKLQLARMLDLTGLNLALFRAQWLVAGPYLRAVIYHDVPLPLAGDFERQLQFYSKHFCPVSFENLLQFHKGAWHPSKPGLVLTFDDGYRSHAEVVAPLLEKYGFVGWFMVPVGFVDAPAAEQVQFARDNAICESGNYSQNERIAMTWAEIRQLRHRHVIGCHTWNHRRLSQALPSDELTLEIKHAKARLERELEDQVKIFSWVGGEEWSYSSAAARMIQEAGFTVSFMTNSAPIRRGSDLLQLQRTYVGILDPCELVRFRLSGFVDLFYSAKRWRVNRLMT